MQASKVTDRGQLVSACACPMLASAPFSIVAIDLYSPGYTTPQGYKYVLTVVDLCTRWVAFLPVKTKYPAEIITIFLTAWCHLHGLPGTILSDRGKEFLGVATAVCRAMGIRQVRTTPYHPRTNGLCESQHKFLTNELKIRSARKEAPHWHNLLTEISFAHNVTPAEVMDNLSPFNLVFGRKPRLSPHYICFPVKAMPLPLPKDGVAKKCMQDVNDRLKGLRAVSVS